MATSVSLQAYCKVILHAAKYPHSAVNGLLLAKASSKPGDENARQNGLEGEDDEGEEESRKPRTHLHIIDAIPLFHQTLSLAPMLEIALNEIDAFCNNKGLVIAGYYQANEHLDSLLPDNVAFRIADKINAHNPRSVLMMVDNKKVTPLAQTLAYRLYVSVGDQEWREDKRSLSTPDASNLVETSAKLLEDKFPRELFDFDNHLDDVGADWTNAELNLAIVEATD